MAGYSPAYLTSLVNSQTGRSVKQWIIERRMTEARELLFNTEEPIKKIAGDLGYLDSGYFTRQFQQIYGVSPRVWQRKKEKS